MTDREAVRRLLIAVAAAALGYAATSTLLQLQYYQGLWGRGWRQLPQAPGKVVEVMPAGQPAFYATTADGSAYWYDEFGEAPWISYDTSSQWSGPTEIQRPCDLAAFQMLFLFPHPAGIVDCFSETTMYADGYIAYIVALDGEGRVWQWENGSSPEAYFSGTCFEVIGTLVGLVVGWGATRTTVIPSEPPTQKP